MDKQHSIAAKICLAVLSLLVWFALITQFYININSKVASISEIVIRYFSYFTITTNLLVAICCTVLLLNPDSKLVRFKTLTATTVYILIVGIIYNVILRFLWKPQGLQMIVDELLHSVIPAMFLIYWLTFVTKKNLKWKNILNWLIYPLVYISFILIRGAFSGFYPYPFINAGELGLQKALLNSVLIAVAFIIMSLLFIAISNFINKRYINSG